MSATAKAPRMSDLPPVQRRRTARDLERATWLRPRDVYEIYGIPSSTLHELATLEDEARRLPSSLIPGKHGRRGKGGLRLVRRADMEAYIARFMKTEDAA